MNLQDHWKMRRAIYCLCVLKEDLTRNDYEKRSSATHWVWDSLYWLSEHCTGRLIWTLHRTTYLNIAQDDLSEHCTGRLIWTLHRTTYLNTAQDNLQVHIPVPCVAITSCCRPAFVADDAPILLPEALACSRPVRNYIHAKNRDNNDKM